MKKNYPEEGELVIGTVTQVFPYGAFVKLDEYGKTGMIHIKEISTAWVKNIRNHVREGQKVVVKVLKVVPEKHQIDLSLRKTTPQQRRWKIQQYKKEKKAEKLLEFYAKENNVPLKTVYSEIAKAIEEEFGDLFDGFEEIVKDKKKIEIIPEKYRKSFYSLLKSNIEIPGVEITGFVTLKCFKKNGVEVIKNALLKGEKMGAEIQLVGTPKHMIKIEAEDYKTAEEKLKLVSSAILEYIEKSGGEGKFERSPS